MNHFQISHIIKTSITFINKYYVINIYFNDYEVFQTNVVSLFLNLTKNILDVMNKSLYMHIKNPLKIYI